MGLLHRLSRLERRFEVIERQFSGKPEKEWKIIIEGALCSMLAEGDIRSVLNHTTNYCVGDCIYQTDDYDYWITAFYKEEKYIKIQMRKRTPMLDILNRLTRAAGWDYYQIYQSDIEKLKELAEKYEKDM